MASSRYGLLTIKQSAVLPRFVNRWWVKATDKASAQIIAGSIVDAENLMFGGQVKTYRTHVWKPNSTPNDFSNQTRDDPGDVAVTNALPPFIVAEFFFGSEGSYLMSKKFRVQVDSSNIVGNHWGTSYMAVLTEAQDAFVELLPYLVTATGDPLTSVTVVSEYNHQQLHKKWYNRTPTPGE